MKHFTWIAALALTGCGGAEFVQATDDPSPLASRAPDGAREASSGFPGEDDAGGPGPDTGGGHLEANAVEAAVNEAGADVRGTETGPADTGADSGAPLPEAGSCTPVATQTHVCGSGSASKTFVSPGEYCQENYMVTTVTFTAAKTPAGCQCAETYTCACLAAHAISCQCTDTPSGPATTCL